MVAPGTHCGLAVDANFIYWTDFLAGNRIGRAGINGAGANPNFLTGINVGCGVASNGTNLYWGTKTLTSIGRSAVSGATPTNAFISSASSAPSPCGVAVNSQYVFWGNIPGLAVGRANLSGQRQELRARPGRHDPVPAGRCSVQQDHLHLDGLQQEEGDGQAQRRRSRARARSPSRAPPTAAARP